MNTTQYLHKCYRKLRRRFPRLPKKVKIVFRSDLDCLAQVFADWEDRKIVSAEIQIAKRLRFAWRLCERELFHECAHLLVPRRHHGHGELFDRQIRRIYSYADARKSL